MFLGSDVQRLIVRRKGKCARQPAQGLSRNAEWGDTQNSESADICCSQLRATRIPKRLPYFARETKGFLIERSRLEILLFQERRPNGAIRRKPLCSTSLPPLSLLNVDRKSV